MAQLLRITLFGGLEPRRQPWLRDIRHRLESHIESVSKGALYLLGVSLAVKVIGANVVAVLWCLRRS